MRDILIRVPISPDLNLDFNQPADTAEAKADPGKNQADFSILVL
ncbi:MAG: hypothetical protein QME69_10740 [Candidatus Saccharicenans sp.]|nr:hypothetical protein [Candidatus Saccharicenans sp.]